MAFEGSEKRLEVLCNFGDHSPEAGVRSLSHKQVNEILTEARCTIVSSLSNEFCDSYVLSESSLFIQSSRIILKTCGTTRLLAALPVMARLIHGLDMSISHVLYSRASFLFPLEQPAPHDSFEAETAFLEHELGKLHMEGTYSVLGDASAGLQWHLYAASMPGCPSGQGNSTLEVCMTNLCTKKAAAFHFNGNVPSAAEVTLQTGIQGILPEADIDAFVFEPCGYSMNGLQGRLASSIHVTPEDGWSYASFELTGPQLPTLPSLLTKVADVFGPSSMTVTVSGPQAASAQPCGTELAQALSTFTPTGSASFQPTGSDAMRFMSFRCSQAPPCAVHLPALPGQLSKQSSCQNLPCLLSPDPPPTVPLMASGALHGAAALVTSGQRPIEATGSSSLSDLMTRQACSDTPSSGSTTPRSALSLEGLSGFEYLSTGSVVADAFVKASLPGQPPAQAAKAPPSGRPSRKAELEAGAPRTAVVKLPQGGRAEILAHVGRLIQEHSLEDPVYVVDLGCAARLMATWRQALPRVQPFYAVKCNSDPAMLQLLASLGAGFDCASEAELEMILDLGISSTKIVYANPCKRPRDLRAGLRHGVQLTTFDTVCELRKIQRWHPQCKALLRIRADDPQARCPLGNKYGAEQASVEPLLQAAKQLGIEVCGVAFHVGSGATNPAAFALAIASARTVHDRAIELGFKMSVLDIGGGFCSQDCASSSFSAVSQACNSALNQYFPTCEGLQIIAEPGRFFAETPFTLACMVIGVRPSTHAAAPALVSCQPAGGHDYWITDGLYGSFNCLIYDHAILQPACLLKEEVRGDEDAANLRRADTRSSMATVFGPTCDGADVILHDHVLPILEVEDWLVFEAMGAYTIAGASHFNGIDVEDVPRFYVCSAVP